MHGRPGQMPMAGQQMPGQQMQHTSVVVTGATYCCVEKGASGGSDNVWKNYRTFFVCYYLDVQMNGKRWQSLRRYSSIERFIEQLRSMKLCAGQFALGAPSFPGKRLPNTENVSGRIRQLNTFLTTLFAMRPELSQNDVVKRFLEGSDVGGGALLANHGASAGIGSPAAPFAGGHPGMGGVGGAGAAAPSLNFGPLPAPPLQPGGLARVGENLSTVRNENLVKVMASIPMRNMPHDESQAGTALAVHILEQLVEVSHASHGLLHYKSLQLMTVEGTCSEPLKAAVAGALREPTHGLGPTLGQPVVGTHPSNPYLDLCRRIRAHDDDGDGLVSQWDLGQVIARLHLPQLSNQKVPSLVTKSLVHVGMNVLPAGDAGAAGAGGMGLGLAPAQMGVGMSLAQCKVDYYTFVQLMQQNGLLGNTQSGAQGGGDGEEFVGEGRQGEFEQYHSNVDVLASEDKDAVRDDGVATLWLVLKNRNGQTIPGYFSTGPEGHSKRAPTSDSAHGGMGRRQSSAMLGVGAGGAGGVGGQAQDSILSEEQWNQFTQQLRKGIEVVRHWRRRRNAGLSHTHYLTCGKRVVKATDTSLTKLTVYGKVLRSTFDLTLVTQVKSVGLNSYYANNFMWDPRKADRFFTLAGEGMSLDLEAVNRAERDRLVLGFTQLVEKLRARGIGAAARNDAMAKMKTAAGRELSEVETAFRSFDVNGDGVLSVQELTRALTNLGEQVSAAEVAALVQTIDARGELNLQGFKALVMARDESMNMLQTFRNADLDGDGSVSAFELAQVLGGTVSQQEASRMVAEADTQGTGNLNFEQFATVLARHRLQHHLQQLRRLNGQAGQGPPHVAMAMAGQGGAGGGAGTSAGGNPAMMMGQQQQQQQQQQGGSAAAAAMAAMGMNMNGGNMPRRNSGGRGF